jgi:hypothetical protein
MLRNLETNFERPRETAAAIELLYLLSIIYLLMAVEPREPTKREETRKNKKIITP